MGDVAAVGRGGLPEFALAVVASALLGSALRVAGEVPIARPVTAVAAAALIDDLKTLSLADAGQLAVRREPVDVGALGRSTARGFQTAAGAAGIELVVPSPVVPSGPVAPPGGPVAAPGRPVTVVGDPDRLAQLLGNLLDNAIRYTPAGGVVAVEEEVAARPGRCGVTAARAPSRSRSHSSGRRPATVRASSLSCLPVPPDDGTMTTTGRFAQDVWCRRAH